MDFRHRPLIILHRPGLILLIIFINGIFVLFFCEIIPNLQVVCPKYYPELDVKLSQPKTETKILVDPSFYKSLTFSLRDSMYAGVENYTQYYVAQYGLRPIDHIQPILPGLGSVINDCTSFQYSINPPKCTAQIDPNKTSVYVVVVSAPGNFEKRNRIRTTWKKQLKNDVVAGLIDIVGFAFVMGKTEDVRTQNIIEQENINYSDITQVNIVDTYNNLTMKCVSILNWLVNYCPRVQFVYRVDDDVYVNVRNLATTIRALQPSVKSIYGRVVGGNIPYRQGGKWSYTFEMWPWHRLPKFIAGAASLISGSAVAPLLASAETTPFFVSEDLYISGLCNRKVNVTLHSSNNMFVFNPPEGNLNACFVKETIAWLTDGRSLMDKSHKTTEELYENKVSCLTGESSNKSSAISNKVEDPNHFVVATFMLVQNPD